MHRKCFLLIILCGAISGCESAPPLGAIESSSSAASSSQTRSGWRIGGSSMRYTIIDRVFFHFDTYSLTPDAIRTLTKQANLLLRSNCEKMVIEGHTDDRGTREYNIALGLRRAEAAKYQLIALGVPADRLAVVSYGKERPAVPGATEASWSQNRRAVSEPGCKLALID